MVKKPFPSDLRTLLVTHVLATGHRILEPYGFSDFQKVIILLEHSQNHENKQIWVDYLDRWDYA